MREIGLFTPQHHSFFLYYLSRIADSPESRVWMFTTQSVHDQIEPLYTDEEYDRYEWVLGSDEEPIDAYFDRVERDASRELDVLWTVLAWGTNRVPPNLLDFTPDCRVVGGVTNLNDWTYNPFDDRVYRAVERLTPLLRERLPPGATNTLFDHLRYLMQPGIADTFDAVHIEYAPMLTFFRAQADWDCDPHLLYPVVFEAEKLPAVERDGTPRIAVPGRISQHIRDVDLLLTAMERVFEAYDGDLVLDFVGRPAGDYESALARIHDLQRRGYDVRYREEWTPFDEFAAALRRSDLILNPLQVHRRIRHPLRADMWTGTTNGTGPIFDAIRYARPIVLPELFPVDEHLDPLVETYVTASDLADLLLDLFENESRLDALQDGADACAREFDVPSQRERFHDVIDRVV